MDRDYIYFKYSDFLKKHYNAKVYKLPVNLPITCPNRIGGTGCTFCADVGTGFEAMASEVSVIEQLMKTKQYIRNRYKAEKFIAYFQNYTNTFMPLDDFVAYIKDAVQVEDIIEISISTRPDCINEDYLAALNDIAKEYQISVTIELGLQSANYHTLKMIRRGHGLAEYLDACMRIKKYGFFLCTHVILNLPGDTLLDVEETSKIISVMGNDLVKVHSLYIAKGTEMGQSYLNGEFEVCSKLEYFERVRRFLEFLHPDIAVERIFSRIPEKDALFSNWGTSWWKLQDEFVAYMNYYDSYQGKNCRYMNGSALKLIEPLVDE